MNEQNSPDRNLPAEATGDPDRNAPKSEPPPLPSSARPAPTHRVSSDAIPGSPARGGKSVPPPLPSHQQSPISGSQDASSGDSKDSNPRAREEKADAQNVIEDMAQRITNVAGIERIEGFSLSALFSETFKRHPEQAVEEYFIVGTRTTTPSIENVVTGWPRPWVFFRMFVGTFIVYIAFVQGWQAFRNINLLPGLITVGSFAVPISTLVFFFEINTRKNISLYQVIRLLFLGGVLSLIFSLVLFNFSSSLSLSWIGAPLAGLVEEPGKLMALLLVINVTRYHYILNGLLFGAAVGTGFAAFESSGYALRVALIAADPNAMLDVILLRGILAPFGHIVWTGMSAAALWKVKGTQKFNPSMLQDPRFYKIFGIAVVLHAIWNFPIQLPFFGKYIALGFIAWTVIFGLIQDGLKQLRAEKREHQAAEAAETP